MYNVFNIWLYLHFQKFSNFNFHNGSFIYDFSCFCGCYSLMTYYQRNIIIKFSLRALHLFDAASLIPIHTQKLIWQYINWYVINFVLIHYFCTVLSPKFFVIPILDCTKSRHYVNQFCTMLEQTYYCAFMFKFIRPAFNEEAICVYILFWLHQMNSGQIYKI